MSLVVHKYGRSSVADAEKIKNVAHRIAEVRKQGTAVVAVVSAMGATTDGLIAMANQVSQAPDEREMDLLLSTGELVSSALLAMVDAARLETARPSLFVCVR